MKRLWFVLAGGLVAVFYGVGVGLFALETSRRLLAIESGALFLAGIMIVALTLCLRIMTRSIEQLREASGRVVRLLDQAPKPACIYAEGCLHGEACELVERCLCDPEARPVMPGEFWNSGPC